MRGILLLDGKVLDFQEGLCCMGLVTISVVAFFAGNVWKVGVQARGSP